MYSFFENAEMAVELGFSTTTKQKQKNVRSFCCGPCFDVADMTFALGLARLRREVDSRPPSRRNLIAPSSRRLCRVVDVGCAGTECLSQMRYASAINDVPWEPLVLV